MCTLFVYFSFIVYTIAIDWLCESNQIKYYHNWKQDSKVQKDG